MTKEIFEKIFEGGVLDPTDLTADEKKRLYLRMTDNGASEAFAYTRFFRDGFAQWEVEGILKAKIDYLHHLHTDEQVAFEVRCTETVATSDGETYRYRHFYEVDGEERSFDITKPGDYWRMLGELRRRTDFALWMQQRGMMSEVTVRKRFSADDWRDYELVGIREVVRQLVEEVKSE